MKNRIYGNGGFSGGPCMDQKECSLTPALLTANCVANAKCYWENIANGNLSVKFAIIFSHKYFPVYGIAQRAIQLHILLVNLRTIGQKDKALEHHIGSHSTPLLYIILHMPDRKPLFATLVPRLSAMAAASKDFTCCHRKATGAVQSLVSAVNHKC